MERKSGFYWVKPNTDEEWTTAKFDSEFDMWYVTSYGPFDEDCISAINENRIMSPGEWE